MRSILLLGVIGLFMVTVFASCVSHNESLLPGPTHETGGLTLDVLPDTFLGGAEVGDLSLVVSDYGDSLMVDITATNASNLKALYFKLGYDKSTLRPMKVDPTGLMGDRDDIINLQMFREGGVVHYGQVLTHPDLRVGFSGDGVLAKVLFIKEPALNTRLVSAAPMEALSAQIVDPDLTTNLAWWYANQGDYNQDMEVNLADLSQIASFFQESVVPDKFPIDDTFAMIDGDQNGEINLADITPIAINFQAIASEFHIYASTDIADYPAGGALVQILGADGIVPHNAGAPGPEGRLRFSVPVADIDGFDANTMGYWVFPSDGDELGKVSDFVGWGNIPRPVIVLVNTPAEGDGSVATPYLVDDLTDYNFTVTDPDAGDVTNHADTDYTVTDSAGTVTKGTDPAPASLDIVLDYTGTFTVSATYNSGLPSNSIYMSIGGVEPPVGLYIMQDPLDEDWEPEVTGTGVDDSTPYVLGVSDGFNATYDIEFSMVANTQADGDGDVIANDTLTWTAFPPFVVDWTADGVFKANMFTGEYIFAQDDSDPPLNSNSVYVVHQSLPDDTP